MAFVPKDKQPYLTAVTVLTVVWVIALVDIAFPQIGWRRFALTVPTALLLPLSVGGLSHLLVDSKHSLSQDLLLGYRYTLGWALTLITTAILGSLEKIKELAHGRASTHVPVIVEAVDYLDVVGSLEHAFAQNGFPTKRAVAPAFARIPPRLLKLIIGNAFDQFIAKELIVLVGKNFEVILHPSDLIVRGPEKTTPHIAAIATETLTFTKAHQTWSKEANVLEDRLLSVFGDIRSHEEGRGGFASAALKIRTIERDLRRLDLVFDEWQILAREKLLVENRLLEALLGSERRATA